MVDFFIRNRTFSMVLRILVFEPNFHRFLVIFFILCVFSIDISVEWSLHVDHNFFIGSEILGKAHILPKTCCRY